MRKKVTAIVAGLVLLLAIGAIAGWWLMGQPLYEPEMVRSGKSLLGPLVPPEQTVQEPYFLVERDTRLFYHAQGVGRPARSSTAAPESRSTSLWPLSNRSRVITSFTTTINEAAAGRRSRSSAFASRNFYANMKELERTLGIGGQVADIERIRRILGQEKLILVGHSFGAFLSSMYAAEFPEHVEALVLVAPSGVLVLPDTEDSFFEVIRARFAGGATD